MSNRSVIVLIVGILLAIALCTIPASADISPVPTGVNLGYLWTKTSDGPGMALPWQVKAWKLGEVTLSANIDVLFGGVTSIESGSIPAAAGIGLGLMDETKRLHLAAAYTTQGHLAGFIGWQLVGLGGASLVGNRLVPQDGMVLGWAGRGPQVTWSRRF